MKPAKRNITVTLDADVIRKARVVAAKRGTSVTGLVREQILRLVTEDDSHDKSWARAKARMRRGLHLGGGPYPTRDELHDRGKLRESLLEKPR